MHVPIEVVLGTKRGILLTACPATNECASRCFCRDQGTSVLLDMVVQVLNGSKSAIARADSHMLDEAAVIRGKEENSPCNLIIPSAHGILFDLPQGFILSSLCLHGRRGTSVGCLAGEWHAGRRKTLGQVHGPIFGSRVEGYGKVVEGRGRLIEAHTFPWRLCAANALSDV